MREVTAAAGTSVGMQRDHNEDRWLVQAPADEEMAARKGWLLIVADGMGGHASGEVAAQIAVDTVASNYLAASEAELEEVLRRGFTAANEAVRARAAGDPSTAGMGATCVAAALRDDRVTVAHVGDCRAYLYRGETLTRLTADHTFVAQLVRDKLIDEEQAKTHPRRNLVTRAIGQSGELKPDVATHPLQPGDLLLLCSDGLSGVLPDEQLTLLLRDHDDLEATARRLIDSANAAGGPDNITLVLAHIG